jgi:hypothetical protein
MEMRENEQQGRRHFLTPDCLDLNSYSDIYHKKDIRRSTYASLVFHLISKGDTPVPTVKMN